MLLQSQALVFVVVVVLVVVGSYTTDAWLVFHCLHPLHAGMQELVQQQRCGHPMLT